VVPRSPGCVHLAPRGIDGLRSALHGIAGETTRPLRHSSAPSTASNGHERGMVTPSVRPTPRPLAHEGLDTGESSSASYPPSRPRATRPGAARAGKPLDSAQNSIVSWSASTKGCILDIELTVVSRKGAVPGWRYQVLGGGALTVAAGGVVTIKVPDQKDVTVRILPPAPKAVAPAWRDDPTAYWPLDVAITWTDGRAQVADSYHQFDVSRSSGGLKVSVVLSRVRDASMLLETADLAKVRTENARKVLFARQRGSRDAGLQHSVLIDDSSKIVRVSPLDTVSPTDDLLLLEMAPPRKMDKTGEKLDLTFRPKLVGAYVGASVEMGNFLVYYYPQIDQDPDFLDGKAKNNLRRDSDYPDDPALGDNHYPQSGTHVDKVILGKLYYYLADYPDPWMGRQLYLGGVAHQIAAASRMVGVVIPIPDLEPVAFDTKGQTSYAMGIAVFPEDLNEIVLEIWAYVQSRRKRVRIAALLSDGVRQGTAEVAEATEAVKADKPGAAKQLAAAKAYLAKVTALSAAELGTDSAARRTVTDVRKQTSLVRVMVSGYSNGNHYLYQFTKNLAALSSPETLPFREFLSLDAPPIYTSVEKTMRDACDKLPDSRSYYYWKYAYDVATRESGKPRTLKGGTSVYQTVLDGRFFYTHIPAAAWPYAPQGDMDMHSWIDATMVCDAMKCSAFPTDPTKAMP
jgi:hypothetical protein